LGQCRWARILLAWSLVVNLLLGPGNVLSSVVLSARFGGHDLASLTAALQTAATVGGLTGTALLLGWRPRRPGSALLLLGTLEAVDALVWVWSPTSWLLVVSAGLPAGQRSIRCCG
jgi:hypothetical protein